MGSSSDVEVGAVGDGGRGGGGAGGTRIWIVLITVSKSQNRKAGRFFLVLFFTWDFLPILLEVLYIKMFLIKTARFGLYYDCQNAGIHNEIEQLDNKHLDHETYKLRRNTLYTENWF